jgi:1-deoxy-D-xylulose-5-phosphate reductoisomerase
MTEVVERTINTIKHIEKPSLEQLFESDAEARIFAATLMQL